MMARIRASAIEFANAWERAVSFQSRITSPEVGPCAEALGDATASTSTVAAAGEDAMQGGHTSWPPSDCSHRRREFPGPAVHREFTRTCARATVGRSASSYSLCSRAYCSARRRRCARSARPPSPACARATLRTRPSRRAPRAACPGPRRRKLEADLELVARLKMLVFSTRRGTRKLSRTVYGSIPGTRTSSANRTVAGRSG